MKKIISSVLLFLVLSPTAFAKERYSFAGGYQGAWVALLEDESTSMTGTLGLFAEPSVLFKGRHEFRLTANWIYFSDIPSSKHRGHEWDIIPGYAFHFRKREDQVKILDPYLHAGIGYGGLEYETGSTSRSAVLETGIGLNVWLNHSIAINGQLPLRLTSYQAVSFPFRVGLAFQF